MENLPFYEYEYIVKNLIDILKEKQEAEEGQQKDFGDMDPNSMMKRANKYLPPGYNSNNPSKGVKMPSFNFPSIPSSLKI